MKIWYILDIHSNFNAYLILLIATMLIKTSSFRILSYRHFFMLRNHCILRFPTNKQPSFLINRHYSYHDRKLSNSAAVDDVDWDGIGANVSHLNGKSSKIAPYWIQKLKEIEKPLAIDLIQQLSPDNALGYLKPTGEEAKSGTMAKQVVEEKEKHVDKVIIFRCGDFYETYGIDALMLIAYCGLNPMANRCRAGCPVKNIQATLDRLTEVGLSAAVYEEIDDITLNRGPSKKPKQKKRVLTQIVSPAYSTYVYNRCLQDDDIEFRSNRPILGIFQSNAGYVLYECHLDERNIIISERLTEESIQSMISIAGCVEPIYISSDINIERNLPFIHDYSIQRIQISSNLDINAISHLLLRQISRDMNIDMISFRLTCRDYHDRPRPIYKSTALQIGLIDNDNVPNLIRCLLTKYSYAYSHRFLYRWILNPPNKQLCDEMQTLCLEISSSQTALIDCKPILEGKIVSLILAQQCNAALFNELKMNMHAAGSTIAQGYDISSSSPSSSSSRHYHDLPYSKFLPSLLKLTESESGIMLDPQQFYDICMSTYHAIDDIILDHHATSSDMITSDPYNRIPNSFFKQNEEVFRGKVKSNANLVIQQFYDDLRQYASNLCEVLHNEFPGNVDICYDIFENQLFFKSVTSGKDDINDKNVDYIAITYDKSKKLASSKARMTTKNVELALDDYITCAERGPKIIEDILQTLCKKFADEALKGIIHACHFSIIFQTIKNHIISSRQRGWQLPQLIDFEASHDIHHHPSMNIQQFSPYWIDRMKAVKNDIILDGIMLLTAPNMSGKSTLMRSVLVIALLANCGLFAPCLSSSMIPRYDCYFLRTASYDIPSEEKSAFAVEMDDVRIVERDATSQSLVMMDEIGKGTSAKDGSVLAAALLEFLSSKGVYTIFATHLHELLSLPMQLDRPLMMKRMGYDEDLITGKIKWNYCLQDGVCLDSMAMHTAQACGISSHIIARAYELRSAYDASIINSPSQSANYSITASSVSSTSSVASLNPRYSFHDLLSSIHDIYPQYKAIVVDHHQDPPILLEGHACVYILHITSPSSSSSSSSSLSSSFPSPSSLSSSSIPDQIYVGETESISQRLYQHRQRRKGSHVNAAVMMVDNRSDARYLETMLIQSFKRAGYDMEQDSDANHVLFSSDLHQLSSPSTNSSNHNSPPSLS